MARWQKYTPHKNKTGRRAIQQRHSCDTRWRKRKSRDERRDRFRLESSQCYRACEVSHQEAFGCVAYFASVRCGQPIALHLMKVARAKQLRNCALSYGLSEGRFCK